MATISLRVISDSICPFCYLGYKKVLRAQELLRKEKPNVKFTMKFEPFQLDPTLGEDEHVLKMERYKAKFGGEARVNAMIESMKERGKPYGINFSYGGMLSQTTSSHRLLELAYHKGGEPMQRALLERLFAGYFEHEKDVGDVEWLAQEASAAGLGTADEIKAFLKSDEMRKDVEEGFLNARRLGVSGVPFFIVNEKYAVEGAQEPETFVAVFKQIIDKQ